MECIGPRTCGKCNRWLPLEELLAIWNGSVGNPHLVAEDGHADRSLLIYSRVIYPGREGHLAVRSKGCSSRKPGHTVGALKG